MKLENVHCISLASSLPGSSGFGSDLDIYRLLNQILSFLKDKQHKTAKFAFQQAISPLITQYLRQVALLLPRLGFVLLQAHLMSYKFLSCFLVV